MCGITNSISDAVDDVGGFVSDVGSSVGNGIKDLGSIVTDAATDIGDYAQNLYDFSNVEVQQMLNNVTKNPEKLALAVPFDDTGNDLYNSIFGTDYDPAVNRWGGPTKSTYEAAAEKGVDVRAAAQMYGVAQLIASYYAGQAASNGISAGYDSLMGTGAAAAGEGAAAGATGAEGASSGMDYYNYESPTFGDMSAGTTSNTSMTGYQPSLGQATANTGTMINPNQVYNPDAFFTQLGNTYNDVAGFINSPIGRMAATAMRGTGNDKAADYLSLFSAMQQPKVGDTAMQALSSLNDLYKGRQTTKLLKQSQQGLTDQLNAALGTYSPDSAYGQQLRKQLERQDAASGRRSQYGQREVELAARLADKQTDIRKAYMSQADAISKNNAAIAGNKSATANAMVGNLAAMYAANSKGINSQLEQYLSSLKNLF